MEEIRVRVPFYLSLRSTLPQMLSIEKKQFADTNIAVEQTMVLAVAALSMIGCSAVVEVIAHTILHYLKSPLKSLPSPFWAKLRSGA